MSNGISDFKFPMDSLTVREIEVLHHISKGASNQDIADELFLSINTVKWHVRNIYEKLDVKNRTQALKKASLIGLLAEQPRKTLEGESRQPHNVPALLSSLLGRDQDIQEALKLLREKRLLTLTGPGGVGKTRLGLEIARTFLEGEVFPGGIYFIELAPVTRPERVGPAIVEGLQLTPPPGKPAEESLARFLKERKTLLLLDNYEHLLEAAPLVSELLAGAPNLMVLATSREALHLSGEQIYPVKPLEIDPSQRLFVQRARAGKPEFDPSAADLGLIDQICARLDHLPLAIELAAARLPLFSLEILLDRLEDRFSLMTRAPVDAPKRHQTLWGAIDWSYQLLDEEEQILFRRLSVFQGSRTINAVQEVGCFDLMLNALDGLTSLHAKNLIRQEEGLDGEIRFYMLETLHEYSRERFRSSCESQEIHRRHAEFYVALAEDAKLPIRGGPDRILWLRRLKADHDNLRVAYGWSRLNEEFELALRMVSCLDFFWIRCGSFDEGVEWIKESLEVADQVPVEVKAGIYLAAGQVLYVISGETQKCKGLLLEALPMFTKQENIRELGWTHVHLLGTSEIYPEDRQLALENLNLAEKYLTEVNDLAGLAYSYNLLGNHESISSNIPASRIAHTKSLNYSRKLGDPLRESIELISLGCLDHIDGKLDSARKFFQRSLLLKLELGMEVITAASVIHCIGQLEYDLGNPRRAAVLRSAAFNLYKLGALCPQAIQIEDFDRFEQKIRKELTSEEFEAAWVEGQAMTPEEAVAFALEGID